MFVHSTTGGVRHQHQVAIRVDHSVRGVAPDFGFDQFLHVILTLRQGAHVILETLCHCRTCPQSGQNVVLFFKCARSLAAMAHRCQAPAECVHHHVCERCLTPCNAHQVIDDRVHLHPTTLLRPLRTTLVSYTPRTMRCGLPILIQLHFFKLCVYLRTGTQCRRSPHVGAAVAARSDQTADRPHRGVARGARARGAHVLPGWGARGAHVLPRGGGPRGSVSLSRGVVGCGVGARM